MPRKLPPRYNPLAYPAGVPAGFDPAHVAANGCVISGVSTGLGAVNLLNPTGRYLPTPPTARIDANLGIGGAFAGTSGSGYVFLGSIPAVASNNFTTACLIRPLDLSDYYVHLSDSGGASGWWIGSTNFGEMFIASAFNANITSGVFLTVGVPYFLAVSVNRTAANTFNVNFLAQRLDTGQVQTSTVIGGSTTDPGASDGNIILGGNSFIKDCFAVIAASMFNNKVALSVPQLLQWSKDPWAFWYPRSDLAVVPSVGGGSTFNDSVSEAATATDTDSVTAVFAAAIANAATATDASSTTAVLASSATEAGTATETEVAGTSTAASITEAGTATEVEAAGTSTAAVITEAGTATETETAGTSTPASRTEAATATETETAGTTTPATITETGTATEAESATAVFAATITEGATAGDTTATGLSDGVTESATATEAETAKATFAATVTEGGTATDTPASVAVFPVARSEAATATDAETAAGVFAGSVSEAGSATTSSDASLGTNIYSVSQVEAASALDSATATVTVSFTNPLENLKMYTGSLGAVSNREDWIVNITLVGADGTLFDLTQASDIETFVCAQGCPNTPILSASLSDGITLTDDNTLQWAFNSTDMSALCASQYDVFSRVTINSIVTQMLSASIAIIEGGPR